jgi:hypothetical protein
MLTETTKYRIIAIDGELCESILRFDTLDQVHRYMILEGSSDYEVVPVIHFINNS